MTSSMLEKRKAHHSVLQAVRIGTLVRPEKCSRCGAPDTPMKDGRTSIQAHHHRGYDYPLDVEWLCIGCHREETPVAYGTKSPAAKLDWPTVDWLRARHANGEGYYHLAREIGVHPKTLYRVIKHQSWPNHARPREQNEWVMVPRDRIEKLLEYADAEYVPNSLFDEYRAMLAASPTGEDA